jgi:hypothetical protein
MVRVDKGEDHAWRDVLPTSLIVAMNVHGSKHHLDFVAIKGEYERIGVIVMKCGCRDRAETRDPAPLLVLPLSFHTFEFFVNRKV